MGELIVNIGGGGGVSSDDVTASKWDVVQGKKTVTTDSSDEVAEGTLPEIFADTGQINSFQSTQYGIYCVDVPKGAYRRGDLGSAGGRINIELSKLRQDIGYTDPKKVLPDAVIAGQAGTMPVAYPNVDGNKIWSTSTVCYEGLVDSGIYNSHYYNGVSYVRSGLPNLSAANIKKGVNIGGLVGTFEGFATTDTDLYLKGNNVAGWKGYRASVEFSSDCVIISKRLITGVTGIYTASFSRPGGITKLNVLYDVVTLNGTPGNYYFNLLLKSSSDGTGDNIGIFRATNADSHFTGTAVFDISNISTISSLGIYVDLKIDPLKISRIWLS